MHKKNKGVSASVRGNHKGFNRRSYRGIFLAAFVLFGLVSWKPDIFSFAFGADRTPANEVGTCPISFAVEETLMLPTVNGISLIMVPKENATLFVEYGARIKNFNHKTPRQTVAAGETIKFTITDLRPNQAYEYRVQCKPAETTVAFAARPTHSFRTLRSEDEVFSFAYATDAHIYPDWTKLKFTNVLTKGYENFHQTLENLKTTPLDFLVIGGDYAITQGCGECEAGTLDGVTYSNGSAETIEQSKLRYQTVFSKDLFGKITSELPIFTFF